MEKETAWKLWSDRFTDGDFCFVLDEQENTYYGKIKATDNVLVVKSFTKKSVEIPWEQITFVAHQGFPVRQLKGADGSPSALQIDTGCTTNNLRQAENTDKKRQREQIAQALPKHVSLAFGDPYLIENVAATLYYPGHDFSLGWNCQGGEEALALTAHDNAKALLWGIPTIFHFEQH